MKKKLLLLLSMLAVTFMFAGCGTEEATVDFEYSNDTLASYAQTKCSEYMNYANTEELYNYIVSLGEDSGIDEAEIEAVEAFSSISDECGDFISFKNDYKISESGDTVVVTLYADCTDQEAEVKVTFESDTASYNMQLYMLENSYGYDEASAVEYLESNSVYPYKVSEVEIAANMTFKDKMKAAGTNTIIGMGIVFIVLIFISFIISLLKYVPMLFDKETREKAKAAKKAAEVSETETKADNSNVEKVEQIVDIVNTSTGESVMNDSELVAVITAAVAAASSDKPAYVNYPSNDKLIARQIRRTRR
jgi:Na+-transporting methylmalonyl-CoA/oxaloacetate decarboxylase gamma subunit